MTKILTASIPLPDQLDEAIREVIESGEYDTQIDVIQSALGLWGQRHQERKSAKERLRTLFEEGLASGPAVPLDMPALRARVKAKLTESQDE